MSITATNLLTAAMRRADVENSSFVGSAEGYALINAVGAEMHDEIVSRLGVDRMLTSTTATVSGGSNTFTIPAAVYIVRGVDRDEGGRWIPLRGAPWDSRGRYASGNFWYRSNDIEYRVQGSTIYLTPVDSADGTYRIWYVPAWTEVTTGSDVIDYPNGWHEFIVAGVAAKIAAKEESDPGPHLRDQEVARQRIRVMAATWNADQPMTIRRVHRRRDDIEDL